MRDKERDVGKKVNKSESEEGSGPLEAPRARPRSSIMREQFFRPPPEQVGGETEYYSNR